VSKKSESLPEGARRRGLKGREIPAQAGAFFAKPRIA
jgi:hypothetical protein